VIGTTCRHRVAEKKPDNRSPDRRSVPRVQGQIKGLIIARNWPFCRGSSRWPR